MSKALQTLREALYGTGLVQPLDAGGRGGDIFCLCRQVKGQERPWVRVVDQLLEAGEAKGVELHVCRRYVRKEGQMVFGWYVGVSAKSAKGLVEAVDSLVPVLKKAQSFAEVEVPKPQPPRHQNPYQDRTPANIKKALELEAGVEGTNAQRRDPEYSGPDPVAPPTVRVGLRSVGGGVQEMPLPHVYTDLNKPKPGSIKGAKGITEK